MWVVYVLQHINTEKLYIGVTKNLARRLREHNSGGRKATTRKSGTWVLVYAEAYRDEHDARERETRIKHHGRAKQELLKRIARSLRA